MGKVSELEHHEWTSAPYGASVTLGAIREGIDYCIKCRQIAVYDKWMKKECPGKQEKPPTGGF